MNHPLYEKVIECKSKIEEFTTELSYFDSLQANQKVIEACIIKIPDIFESNHLEIAQI